MSSGITGYKYHHAKLGEEHAYLMPVLGRELARLSPPPNKVFDLGCGNGAVARWLTDRGYRVAGVDPSCDGIRQAKLAYPELDLREGSTHDDLVGIFGTFPVVVSLEVIEHVYAPRDYLRSVWDLLEPGGRVFLSTPYHGYVKNLVLALSGKLDAHFTALWDHGHIKFWSPRTITALFRETGFDVECIHRVGRLPVLAKSMMVVARKPE